MAPFKIVFSDIDGTFLKSDHSVSEAVKDAARKVIAKGVPVILVSGRMPSAIRLIQNEAGFKAPFISYSGALTSDADGKTLGSIGLNRETALKIKRYAERFYPDIECCTYSEDRWITDDDTTPAVNAERKIIKKAPEKGKPSELLSPEDTVHKLLCIGDPERLDALRLDLIPQFPECRIYKSQPRYLEVMSKDACKSAAAELLCEKLGIRREEVLAFGDNYNDADLLEFAGTGVAMGNAPDDVKSSADEIADTNDNDGTAKILKRVFDV